ncbi:MAG: S41 family peptidase [Lentisphaeria bacterium]
MKLKLNINQRVLYVIFTCALAVNLAIGYTVYAQEKNAQKQTEAFEKVGIMMRVLHLIQQDYVDPEKVDYENLIYNAMHGMVSSLDPHSSFLEPDQFEQIRETTEGEFGGLGVVVTMKEGKLTIVTPIEGTPGSRVGLAAGDQILAINGENISDQPLTKIVKKMKGKPGTEVTLKIYRPETDETLEMTIERAIIEVKSVRGAHDFGGGIRYVRITQFDENTAADLETVLKDFDDKEFSSLILDLRNNPGGLLNAAVEVGSLFLKPDKLVVSTIGRQPSQKQKYFTDNGRRWPEVPIIILVNEGSASAAEIVSGCLQDYGRAVLVGNTTFGKGSVQNIIKLPDGSALRLTTAKYYTPSKRVIHDKGITPDILVKLSQEELRKLIERQAKMSGDRQLDPENDPQLARALEALRSHKKFKALAE